VSSIRCVTREFRLTSSHRIDPSRFVRHVRDALDAPGEWVRVA
jgi:hypothetical protein